MHQATLQWFDYMVIAGMLCISLFIGLYYRFTGGRQKTAKEYFTANKSMGTIPVAIALMVSFISAITLLGVSEENYSRGTQFAVFNIATLIGTPIVCYGFLPVFWNLGTTSAYEYLEKRFGYGARSLASFMYWVQLLLYSGVVLFAPCLALQATTGFPMNWSIATIGVVCSIYSTIGGIKAVLITDVFQGVLMFVSVFMIIISAAVKVGGLLEIWKIASEDGRIEFDNVSLDPTERHTIWSLLIGGLVTFISLYGVNQVQVQRILTVKSLKSARLALWLSWPMAAVLSLSTCFSGLAMYSYYRHCDPLKAGRIESSDMLMPLYVMDNLSSIPGMAGLFVAGVFSAGLSTISATLSALAIVSVEDYLKPICKNYFDREISEQTTLFVGKLLTFCFGIICIALAFVVQSLGAVLQIALTLVGVIGGPLLGIFVLGMLFRTANQNGVVVGASSALMFLFWLAFGQPRPHAGRLPVAIDGCDAFGVFINSSSVAADPPPKDPSSYFYMYRISYMWYGPLGFIITVILGLIVSSMTFGRSTNTADIDPNLFFPFIASRLRAESSSAELHLGSSTTVSSTSGGVSNKVKEDNWI